ncbi:Hypothetical predicted protein [Lecanosticta acicola]|uniref:NAD(P)-binding protein n=1 Tax=Lecanosticta acicola TaxID=111012 RepID=A0AAI9E875_9PEZI|nr:Hypothetical predicted protein [Lecanosticta acicola]
MASSIFALVAPLGTFLFAIANITSITNLLAPQIGNLEHSVMASKPVILITGANQGLGYYATQQLAATGKYHVLVGSRDVQKAFAAIESLAADKTYEVDKRDLSALQINVSSDSSIDAAAKQVQEQFGHLDMLLNNAGIAMSPSDASKMSLRQFYQSHFDTNVFGAAAVTEAFLPLLRKSSGKRLAFTSTGLSSLAKAANGTQPADKWPVYRASKTALSMVMLNYVRILEPEGFVVAAAAPGHCATNLNNFSGKKDPRDGAKMLVKALLGSKDEVHGHVFSEKGKEPW